LTSTANAQTALGTIDSAIQTVSTKRAAFGAAQNRLAYASNTIQTMSANMTAANGRIVDVDVAAETATMSKNQVLSQAGISVLAQANQIPQMAFGLLQ
jgi:flagellin